LIFSDFPLENEEDKKEMTPLDPSVDPGLDLSGGEQIIEEENTPPPPEPKHRKSENSPVPTQPSRVPIETRKKSASSGVLKNYSTPSLRRTAVFALKLFPARFS